MMAQVLGKMLLLEAVVIKYYIISVIISVLVFTQSYAIQLTNSYYLILHPSGCNNENQRVLELIKEGLDSAENFQVVLLNTRPKDAEYVFFLRTGIGSKKIELHAGKYYDSCFKNYSNSIVYFKDKIISKAQFDDKIIWSRFTNKDVILDETGFKIPMESGFVWSGNSLYVLNDLEQNIGRFSLKTGTLLNNFWNSNNYDSTFDECMHSIWNNEDAYQKYSKLKKNLKKVGLWKPHFESIRFSNLTAENGIVAITGVIEFPYINEDGDTGITNENIILFCKNNLKLFLAKSLPRIIYGSRVFYAERYSTSHFIKLTSDTSIIIQVFELKQQYYDSAFIMAEYGVQTLTNVNVIKTFLLPNEFIYSGFGYSFTGGKICNFFSKIVALHTVFPIMIDIEYGNEIDPFNMSDPFKFSFNTKINDIKTSEDIPLYQKYVFTDNYSNKAYLFYYYNNSNFLSILDKSKIVNNLKVINVNDYLNDVATLNFYGNHFKILKSVEQNWVILNPNIPLDN